MECKDFDIRRKGDWQYIGFWSRPETEEDAKKLATVLRRIMNNLAEDVKDSMDYTASSETEVGIAN